MNEFVQAHPFIFGVAIWLSFQAIASILKSAAVIIHGTPKSDVDLKPIENKLSAMDQKLSSMDRKMALMGHIADGVATLLRLAPAAPAAPSGDPLEAFKRSVSSMSGKERAEMTQKAREWMFSGVSK